MLLVMVNTFEANLWTSSDHAYRWFEKGQMYWRKTEVCRCLKVRDSSNWSLQNRS